MAMAMAEAHIGTRQLQLQLQLHSAVYSPTENHFERNTVDLYIFHFVWSFEANPK